MSSDKENISWPRFGNEKLYLATLQLELMSAIYPSIDDDSTHGNEDDRVQSRAQRLACFWAAVNFIYSSFEGLLCEVAEANQKRVIVKTIASLEILLGNDCADVIQLKELSEKADSWLFALLSLKHTYESPVVRISFSERQDNEIIDINYTNQEKKHYVSTLIATSASESEQNITPADRRWNIVDLTPDLILSIIAGLKSYMKDFRDSAVEW